MAGAKETPRQKMIGMMYLFLTAMLALNVSRDILNAFSTVDASLVNTKVNFTQKNQILYSQFEKAKAEDEEKAQEWYDKAMLAKNYSQKLVDFIEHVRAELIHEVDGVSMEVADTMKSANIAGADNYDVPTHYLCGSSESNYTNGKASEIKNKIKDFKEKLFGLLEEKDRDKVNMGLDVSDDYNPITERTESWEVRNFYHNVTVAAIALLNKTIIEVRNAEAEVVQRLLEYISAGDFRFDKIEAKVIPKSNYILSGGEYEADIFVAAYSTTQDPYAIIGDIDTNTLEFKNRDTTKIIGKGGKVKYVKQATSLGSQEYKGTIYIQAPDGSKKPYFFQSDYFVARPSATISADKMNVVYVGLDNPVSISVPGVPAGEESISISGAQYSNKGRGNYIIRPNKNARRVNINVFAEIGGERRKMGDKEFRIQTVPDPIPKVAGRSSGSISSGLLKAAPYVVADLENFLFEGVKYRVVSFEFQANINGLLQTASCQGNQLNNKAIGLLQRVQRGSKIFFDNIKARGPDGTTRRLSPVILKLN